MFLRVVRQPVRAVVHRPDDDRPIGIAFLELDDHLMAGPRVEELAEPIAGPALSDANQARAILVVRAAVPVEPDTDTAELVVRPFVCWLDDHSRVRASDDRPWRALCWPERD